MGKNPASPLPDKKGKILSDNVEDLDRAFLPSLRHTYISYLLEQGIPTKKVKERAGHFSLTITDHYTHAIPSSEIIEDALDFNPKSGE